MHGLSFLVVRRGGLGRYVTHYILLIEREGKERKGKGKGKRGKKRKREGVGVEDEGL